MQSIGLVVYFCFTTAIFLVSNNETTVLCVSVGNKLNFFSNEHDKFFEMWQKINGFINRDTIKTFRAVKKKIQTANFEIYKSNNDVHVEKNIHIFFINQNYEWRCIQIKVLDYHKESVLLMIDFLFLLFKTAKKVDLTLNKPPVFNVKINNERLFIVERTNFKLEVSIVIILIHNHNPIVFDSETARENIDFSFIDDHRLIFKTNVKLESLNGDKTRKSLVILIDNEKKCFPYALETLIE